jgi:hypothetical protein
LKNTIVFAKEKPSFWHVAHEMPAVLFVDAAPVSRRLQAAGGYFKKKSVP